MLDEHGAFTSLVIGAPDLVNTEFVRRWITDADWPLVALRLDGVRAVYVLDEWRRFSSYVIGAPDIVNRSFGTRWVIADPSGPPPPPSGLRATKVDIPLAPDDIWVSWNHAPGATSYEVYHSSDEVFSFEASVAAPGYLDEDAVFLGPDSYKVRACSTSGCSDFSMSATEGEDGFISILLDVMPQLGLDAGTVCTRLLTSGVEWILVQVAPFLMPIAPWIASLVGDALDCREA